MENGKQRDAHNCGKRWSTWMHLKKVNLMIREWMHL